MHRRTTPPPARRPSSGHALPALRLSDRTSTDEEVLARLLRDESEASWRSFLARFEPILLATIARAARARGVRLGADDRNDIRGSFLAMLLANDRRPLRAFDPTRGVKPAAWIAMLADRHAIDCLRARRSRARCGDALPLRDAGLEAPAPTPEDVLLRVERIERLRSAAATLARRQRQLYTLHVEQGLELAEVAGRMGTTLQTVHSCRHKMERSLRSAVQRMMDDAAPAAA